MGHLVRNEPATNFMFPRVISCQILRLHSSHTCLIDCVSNWLSTCHIRRYFDILIYYLLSSHKFSDRYLCIPFDFLCYLLQADTSRRLYSIHRSLKFRGPLMSEFIFVFWKRAYKIPVTGSRSRQLLPVKCRGSLTEFLPGKPSLASAPPPLPP